MSKKPATQTAQDNVSATRDNESVFSLLMASPELAGKSPVAVVRQWLPLSRGSGKLTIHDYFRFRLFDDELHDKESRRQFVSDSIYWRVLHKTLDMTWKAAVEDKALMYSLLQAYGLRTPETVAVVDRGERDYGKPQVLRNLDDFASFLAKPGQLPLFLKPVLGSGSAGTLIAERLEGDQVIMLHRESVRIGDLFDQMIGDDPYLLQRILRNHPQIGEIVPHLATTRFYNFFQETGMTTDYPMMKIPAGFNIADNFWRGNLLAALDSETGRIQRVIQGTGLNQSVLTHHPDSNAELVGFEVPCWEAVKTLNEKCARLFAPVRFVSTDIAVSPEGPAVIEVNYGGSFALPQILYNTGFLTSERKAFFKRYGWKF